MRRLWVCQILAFALLTGCLYDENNRCGANEVYAPESQGCVCASGFGSTAKGCAACGANQDVVDHVCACKTGFLFGAGNACVPAPLALGAACDASTPCTDSTYHHCATTMGPQGYCTKSPCTSDADCDAGFTCTTWESMPYCRRPPTGLGQTCHAQTDCALLDASNCDTSVGTCQVSGCTLSPNTCQTGYVCCDFGAFVPGLTECVAVKCPF